MNAICLGLFFLFCLSKADAQPAAESDVVSQIESTRASISETEKNQREALRHLFTINSRVKDIAKRNARLSERLINHEANVRALAQDVQTLEAKSEQNKQLLNRRLRQLYQEHGGTSMKWLFTVQSPADLERHHRFLKLMIENDHQRLKRYLEDLREVRNQRAHLKSMVRQLTTLRKESQQQEGELAEQLRQKSHLLADLKKTREGKIMHLRDLRSRHVNLSDWLSYAFFERKGNLRSPIEAPLTREYGAFVDPAFRFRLMHKGLYYAAKQGSEIKAVADGTVALADRLPGYGYTLIIDHGDNYHSVYAFASRIKVKPGAKVREGELIAYSGDGSPLFGPGLYFEIRHFADAVDPRPWIKESWIKTAKSD